MHRSLVPMLIGWSILPSMGVLLAKDVRAFGPFGTVTAERTKICFARRHDGVRETMKSSGSISFLRAQHGTEGTSSGHALSMEPRTATKKEPSSETAGNATRIRGMMKPMDLPYASALAALQAYHRHHGDLVLPRRFVVPADPAFPSEWHGVDLASTVYHMNWWKSHIRNHRHRVSELNGLGFVWERLQPEWNLILEALVTYRSLHCDLLVPQVFVVPRDDAQWPRSTWGLALGSCVHRIRARNDFLRGLQAAARRDQLDGLGFVWDIQEFRFRKFYAALRRFAQLEESGPFSRSGERRALRVPSKFVVPRDRNWPEGLWDYPLGDKCTAVRQKSLYIKDEPILQGMLTELGFRFTGNADLGWLKVVHAAAIYSRQNGHKLDVPLHFHVPSKPNHLAQDDWPWPEYLSGFPLGQRLKDIRVKGAYLKGECAEERRRQLVALGMNWAPKKGRPKRRTLN